MSLLTLENISHTYGDKSVLRNVSLRLLAGEHIGLVGRNGSGKSTLMRIMTGQSLPDGGRVEWLPGVDFGYLEQHVELDEFDTVQSFLRSAFYALDRLESELYEISNRLATADATNMERILNRMSAIQEELERNDFYALDARIERVARGLGLHHVGLDTPVRELSGGQRTKALLGKLLLQQPTVLLLDEPTNYLDTAYIEWLTSYLQAYPHAFVLISHDVGFLNAVVNVVYHLEHQSITRYVGNYRQFEDAYRLRQDGYALAFQRQQEEIRKLETYIQKNIARASTSKQAKSRQKRLEKIDRLEQPNLLPKPRFSFRVGFPPTSTIVEASGIQVGYDAPLFPPVNLVLGRGSKVAIIGANGVGKTTLLRCLLGLQPLLAGSIRFGERVKPHYFAQEWQPTTNESALDLIWGKFPKLSQSQVRQALARCGLRTEHIFQSFAALSGGEQTKVRLCELMLGDGNWLVLDEPTNHLDVAAQEALKQALKVYPGAVLLVSHDAEFYQDWVTDIWDVAAWTKGGPPNKTKEPTRG